MIGVGRAKGDRMIFTTEITIRGYHLDGYGHVNNARWVELMEEARWRWLDTEPNIATWREQGLGLAVIKLAVSYRQPARAHDLVEFRCWITRLGGRSAVCRQQAVRKATGERLLEAEVSFVLFDLESGRPRAMAGPPRELFLRYLEREGEA
jgi:thioesterase-3